MVPLQVVAEVIMRMSVKKCIAFYENAFTLNDSAREGPRRGKSAGQEAGDESGVAEEMTSASRTGV